MSIQPIKIFISYSHKDESHLNDFQIHLSSLKREKLIENWTDQGIVPGEEWDQSIKKKLEQADLIVFLISADFLASDYIHHVEISEAMKRYSKDEVVIIPIVIRPCEFEALEISKFQALPKGLKPVSKWDDKDEAWLNVVKQLRLVVKGLIQKRDTTSNNSQDQTNSTNSNSTSNNYSNGSNQTTPNSNDLSVVASDLRKAISKDKIKTVIDQMLELSESLDGDLYNNVVLISSRYNGNKRNVNMGIVSTEESGLQQARIRTSLLSLIDEMEKDFA